MKEEGDGEGEGKGKEGIASEGKEGRKKKAVTCEDCMAQGITRKRRRAGRDG